MRMGHLCKSASEMDGGSFLCCGGMQIFLSLGSNEVTAIEMLPLCQELCLFKLMAARITI